MYDTCLAFAEGIEEPVLVLTGGTGPGKSHLLEAIVRRTLEGKRSARFEMSSSLLDRLRRCYRYDSEADLADLIDWYQGLWLLALDDMGLERGTEWEREKLTRLVEERITYGKKLIISTNLNAKDMANRLGERLASRLHPRNPDLKDVRLVTSAAPDYRGKI